MVSNQQQQFENAGVSTSTDGSTFVLVIGSGDDKVEVVEVADGRLAVNVNGKRVELTAEQSQDVRIETGEGDDMVIVDTDVRTGLSIDGGPGADVISGGLGDDKVWGGDGNDRILGSAGDDVLDGGAGDDYLEGQAGADEVWGGDGIDTIYGSEGDDTLEGGAGDDYLEGQAGSDTILGGGGDDVVSGGDGDDYLDGESGDDRVFPGSGNDTVNASPTELIAGDPMAVPATIAVEGSEEFQSRLASDLALIAQTNEGRRLFETIKKSTGRITIVESDRRGSFSDPAEGSVGSSFYNKDGTPGPGRNEIVVGVRPRHPNDYVVGGPVVGGPVVGKDSVRERMVPPVVTLLHELIHASQQITGTLEPGRSKEINLETGELSGRDGRNPKGTKNSELDAIGLAFKPDRNRDGIPDEGVVVDDHVTENSFRQELGIEPRTEY